MRWILLACVVIVAACADDGDGERITSETRGTPPYTATGDAPSATNAPSPSATNGRANVIAGEWRIDPGIGGVTFYGVIVNNGNAAASATQVNVTLFDASRQVLGSSNAGIVRPIIPPGEISPFKGVISIADTAAIADQRIQIQFDTLDPSSFAASLYTDTVTIDGAQWTADKIVGEARNTGDEPITGVAIIAIGYDATGVIVGVEKGFAELAQIDPGAMSAFDIGVFGYDAPPDTFEVWAYARPAS